jgi:histidinol-phosphatase (PHP family)
MVELGGFEILGHIDSIKKHNRQIGFFSENEDWYRDLVLDTLEVVSGSGLLLEVNTGGMSRNYTQEPYPSKWILRRCAEMGIPVVLNSDAHRPDLIDYAFRETEKLLVSVGIPRGRVLLDGEWRDVSYGE